MNKYRAKKVSLDGYVFDSKAEARRYGELKLVLRAKGINRLRVHQRFPLFVNGIKIATYIADFTYYEQKHNDGLVVEDVKSPVTAKLPAFRMKKKLMLALYGIEIKEVRA